jgi:hypothetical protein
VDEKDIKLSLEYNSKKISRLIKDLKLTGLEVTRALNIIPSITAGSLKHALKASPAPDKIAPI